MQDLRMLRLEDGEGMNGLGSREVRRLRAAMTRLLLVPIKMVEVRRPIRNIRSRPLLDRTAGAAVLLLLQVGVVLALLGVVLLALRRP